MRGRTGFVVIALACAGASCGGTSSETSAQDRRTSVSTRRSQVTRVGERTKAPAPVFFPALPTGYSYGVADPEAVRPLQQLRQSDFGKRFLRGMPEILVIERDGERVGVQTVYPLRVVRDEDGSRIIIEDDLVKGYVKASGGSVSEAVVAGTRVQQIDGQSGPLPVAYIYASDTIVILISGRTLAELDTIATAVFRQF